LGAVNGLTGALAGALATAGLAVPSSNRDEQWDAPYAETEQALADPVFRAAFEAAMAEALHYADPNGPLSKTPFADCRARDLHEIRAIALVARLLEGS
jgi:hypothetical protein